MSVREKWAILIDDMRVLGYEQRLPDVVGIGVIKSGTNAFYEYLAEHPQMSRSIFCEVRYFDLHYSKGIEYYRASMGFSRTTQHTMEKSPPYFFLENAPERAKLLVCVRDPVERLISQFRHYSEDVIYNLHDEGGKRAEAMAETALSQGHKLTKFLLNSRGQLNRRNFLVQMSTYSKYFKMWLEYFPRDRFFIVSHERVNKDLYAELKKIEAYLGMGPFYERKMFYYDEKRHVPCMYGICPHNTTPGDILPKAQLSPDVIKKLRNYFRPFNREFEQLTQLNFSWTNL